ncbi:MAG: rod shape-determining protein MreD, partial [Alphaproteobacteria bacterium]|nr:rod shape-determining protein MreD [Alphaproteobacteria bacterium]
LLSTLILMFISFVPINSMQFSYFRPSVGLICVFCWILKRGDYFGYVSAFIVGFLTDVYSSSPLGTNILLMLLTASATYWLAHYFRNSSFGAIWFIFSFVALGEFLFKWILLMIYSGSIIPLWEGFLGYVSTIMFYPLIALINLKIQNRFLPREYIDE